MTALTGFRIMMPPGWSQYRVDEESRQRFVAKVSERAKALGQPEFDVRLRMLANSQWRRLEQTRTHSIYLADREVEGLAHLPLSIAVRQQVAPVGADFAAGLRGLTTAEIVTHDTAIGPIQRWESTVEGTGDLAGITTRSVGYGFALPGEQERRGLVFIASLPYPDDADPLLVDAAIELSDSIMETFRWQ
ncbi:hypothetical protein FVO59_07535 [Microbacterium esteraromaticum]|uniref:Uncharacterized protein n=1 Tax=Microbacterium esteraromaticum TaxID=57043 RepID=A0A7D7WGP7_9MICO|nr:hypothetical protein [Microbacterium esteraromaticum]QMU97094.1 hypothetical protein FVO59_07535 [Microbacterium esteraromaticum]